MIFKSFVGVFLSWAGYDCHRPPIKGFKRVENDLKSTLSCGKALPFKELAAN